MNPILHSGLTVEKWAGLSDERKILNIASELSRARHWMAEDEKLFKESLLRALELVDLTIETPWNGRSRFLKKELLRFREALAGFYVSQSLPAAELLLLLKHLLDFCPGTHDLQLET